MKRFQLTIVFVLFSAMTIGAGALAVNSLMSSSAERSLLSLTQAQSGRDAQFIATLVSQLLAEDAPSEPVSPPFFGAPSEFGTVSPFNSTTLQVNAPTVLDALDITGLAIYNTAGARIWSSDESGVLVGQLDSRRLENALNGEIASAIIEDDSSTGLVISFVPLIGETSGVPVQVLGVSRTVPAGVAGLLDESRNAVLKTTMISLSGVFLILLAFVLAADIRIWRRNEEALELERVQQNRLGRRNRQLTDLNEAKNRFISAISHELSNPLASLVSFLDLVLKNRTGNLTERQIDQLTTARRNGSQLNRLVSDLAHASRANVGDLEIIYDEFEIRPVLDEVAESLSHDLNMRQQVLKIDAGRDIGVMHGDRGRMVQVFSNLLGNASKYSPGGATIRLSAKTKGGSLHIDVIDNGIGISEEDLNHVFEMFWRAENPNVEGAGIGLVLAKQIIEGHGGQVSVSSVLGEGTTVSFDVPLKPITAALNSAADLEEMGPERWERAA